MDESRGDRLCTLLTSLEQQFYQLEKLPQDACSLRAIAGLEAELEDLWTVRGRSVPHPATTEKRQGRAVDILKNEAAVGILRDAVDRLGLIGVCWDIQTGLSAYGYTVALIVSLTEEGRCELPRKRTGCK